MGDGLMEEFETASTPPYAFTRARNPLQCTRQKVESTMSIYYALAKAEGLTVLE